MPRIKKNKAISFKRGFKRLATKEILRVINVPFKCKKLQKFNRYTDKLKALVEIFKEVPDPVDELDYLAQYNDSGQDFEDFRDGCPHEMNKLGFIYYIGVGDFVENKLNYDDLIDYSKCFFSEAAIKRMDLSVIMKRVEDEKEKHGFSMVASYKNYEQKIKFRYDKDTEKIQLYCASFHGFLSRIKPKDACCLVGLTGYDLYVDDSDLFIAGLASGKQNVAIFSYLRYNPNFR